TDQPRTASKVVSPPHERAQLGRQVARHPQSAHRHTPPQTGTTCAQVCTGTQPDTNLPQARNIHSPRDRKPAIAHVTARAHATPPAPPPPPPSGTPPGPAPRRTRRVLLQ